MPTFMKFQVYGQTYVTSKMDSYNDKVFIHQLIEEERKLLVQSSELEKNNETIKYMEDEDSKVFIDKFIDGDMKIWDRETFSIYQRNKTVKLENIKMKQNYLKKRPRLMCLKLLMMGETFHIVV
ncbi:hypothetical protein HHI36_020277 [Cryptolaemus montrouzieri]|uniref:Uncharacterized protein n=1 Tax=Cryptolaemus montrouzieri TaxID=559131 RepID=A0ABD2N9S0_9CUCU